MTIAFDARYLGMVVEHRANPEMLMGIGAYSRHLIERMMARYPEQRYLVLTDRSQRALAMMFPRVRVVPLPRAPQFPIANAIVGRLYRGWIFDRIVLGRAHRRHGFELLHHLGHDIVVHPTNARKTVVTVHDLAVNVFPRTAFNTRAAAWVWNLQTRMLSRAHAVITDSEATRRDVLRFARADPNKVHTVHCGKGDEFTARRRPTDRTALAQLGINGRYYLHVGGIQPSKNMANLLAGFARIAGTDPKVSLVLAGEFSFVPDDRERMGRRIRELGLQERVIETGFVGTSNLPALYRGALALVHPSWYEGFGLTAVEAAACGCPVVISDRGSLPEVMGDAALHVDPSSPESIADGMRRVCDRSTRAALAARGIKQAALYDWTNTVQAVQEIYQQL